VNLRAASHTVARIAPLQSIRIIRSHKMRNQKIIFAFILTVAAHIAVSPGWATPGDFPAAGTVARMTAGGMPPANSVFRRVSSYDGSAEIPWGENLKDAPRRCLLIVPRGGAGDAVQLRYHIPIEVETLSVWSATALANEDDPDLAADPAWTRRAVQDRLAEAVKGKWDVVILANLHSRALPEEFLSAVLEQVADGKGLLVAHLRDGDGEPLRAVLDTLEPDPDGAAAVEQVKFLPEAVRDRTFVTAYRHGKGRIVEVQYPGEFPEHSALLPVPEDPVLIGRELERDAWSFCCRMVLFAAGWREPVSISRVEDASPKGPDPREIPPDLPDAFVQSMYLPVAASALKPISIGFSAPLPEPAYLQVRVRLPDSEDCLIIREPEPLPSGVREWTTEIPAGAGTRIIDVWLKDRRGRTLTWGGGACRFAGWPDYTRPPEFERTWVKANDTLKISVSLIPHVDPNRTGIVAARCVDMFGRVLGIAASPVTAEGGEKLLALPVAEAGTGVLKIEVSAWEGDISQFHEPDMDRGNRYIRYVSVRRAAHPGDFELNLSDRVTVPDLGCYAQWSALARLGFAARHAPGGEEQLLVTGKAGLGFVPELARFYAARTGENRVREPVLYDVDFQAAVDQQIREGVAVHWAGGSRRYSLGWGNAFLDSDESGSRDLKTREAFQQWLQDQFESLEELNATWGSRYASWQDPADEPAVDWLSPGGRPLWIAWQQFTVDAFQDFLAARARDIRTTDRQGLVGFRMLNDVNPARGCWLPRMAEVMDWLAFDISPENLARFAAHRSDHCRGYGVVDSLFSRWNDPAVCRWLVWLCAGHALNGVWIEAPSPGTTTDLYAGAVNPDGAPSKGLSAMVEAARKINRGAVPWLHAEPARPRVLLFDSLAAALFRKVDTDFPEVEAARSRWVDLLDRMQVDWAFLDPLHLDRLADPAVKVVVLPGCRALTDGEIAAFLEFHDRGGILVADLLPGAYTTFGVRRSQSPLEAVFGVCPAEVQDGEPGWVEVAPASEKASGLSLVRAGRLAPADGTRIGWSGGGTICWATSADGRAFLLNHGLRQSLADSDPPEISLIRDVLGAAVGPDEMAESKRAFPPGLWVRRGTLGSAVLYFALPGPDKTVRFRLPDPGKGYRWVDLLSEPSRKLRSGGKISLENGEAGLWAAVPEESFPLLVSVPPGTEAGKRFSVKVVLQGLAESRQIGAGRPVRIALMDPSGRSPRWFQREIWMIKNGAISVDLFFARNDPAGPWRIQVEDLFTGEITEKTFQVTPPSMNLVKAPN